MNLRLILCAFDRHDWGMYCARSSSADRDTQRECGHCRAFQQRWDRTSPWREGPLQERDDGLPPGGFW